MRVITVFLFLILPIICAAQEWQYNTRITSKMNLEDFKYYDTDTVSCTCKLRVVEGRETKLGVVETVDGESLLYNIVDAATLKGGSYLMSGYIFLKNNEYGIRLKDEESWIVSPDMMTQVRYINR